MNVLNAQEQAQAQLGIDLSKASPGDRFKTRGGEIVTFKRKKLSDKLGSAVCVDQQGSEMLFFNNGMYWPDRATGNDLVEQLNPPQVTIPERLQKAQIYSQWRMRNGQCAELTKKDTTSKPYQFYLYYKGVPHHFWYHSDGSVIADGEIKPELQIAAGWDDPVEAAMSIPEPVPVPVAFTELGMGLPELPIPEQHNTVEKNAKTICDYHVDCICEQLKTLRKDGYAQYIQTREAVIVALMTKSPLEPMPETETKNAQ